MTESKSDLRRRFSALRDGLSPEDRAAATPKILTHLFSLAAWKNAPLVCGYMPTKSEIDITPVWQRAISEGKSYALPVTLTNAREGEMIFRRLSEYAPQALLPARYGLSEPAPTCPALALEDFENALIIVPGLAFDDGGYRIGYGGGYYDRLLDELFRARVTMVTVGLVYAQCHTPALLPEPHDIPVDYVITERKVIAPHGQAHRLP